MMPRIFARSSSGLRTDGIALIVNSEGFPFSYETFDGNRADVSTMETILRMVERKYGKARGSGVRSGHRERGESGGDPQGVVAVFVARRAAR